MGERVSCGCAAKATHFGPDNRALRACMTVAVAVGAWDRVRLRAGGRQPGRKQKRQPREVTVAKTAKTPAFRAV